MSRGQAWGLRCCYWCCCSVYVCGRERVRDHGRCDPSAHTELLLCPSYSELLRVCPCPRPLTSTARKKEQGADVRVHHGNRARCIIQLLIGNRMQPLYNLMTAFRCLSVGISVCGSFEILKAHFHKSRGLVLKTWWLDPAHRISVLCLMPVPL